MHGLEGSSIPEYMLGVARNGLAAGMNVVRMNQRNCGGMDRFARRRSTTQACRVMWPRWCGSLSENDGVSRFALVGFSMGGNLVSSWRASGGKTDRRNFERSRQFVRRWIWPHRPTLCMSLATDFMNLLSDGAVPQIPAESAAISRKFDIARLRGISSLRMFDDRITAYYCGFTGADDYYARAAAANVVVSHCGAGADDSRRRRSVYSHAARDVASHRRESNITYVETDDGGHCAFLGEPNGHHAGDHRRDDHHPSDHDHGDHAVDLADDGRWAEREVVEFLTNQKE